MFQEFIKRVLDGRLSDNTLDRRRFLGEEVLISWVFDWCLRLESSAKGPILLGEFEDRTA